MIKTIYTIGKEISEGRDLWEDIIESKTEKPKEGFSYLVLNIIFDLDGEEIIISKDNISEFDSSYDSLKSLMYLKTLGRRMKSPYLCVDNKKIKNLFKTLFGEPDKKGEYPKEGDLLQVSKAGIPNIETDTFSSILAKLIEFREKFEQIFKDSKSKFTLEKVNESLELSNKSKIVLFYPSVTSKEFDFKNKPLSSFDTYLKFLEEKYLKSNSTNTAGEKKLCYATGEYREDTEDVNFSGRYNINKLFVKETKNYATNFNNKDFNKNYQVSAEVQTFLDRGSEYVLKNLITTIADVRHVVIPQFLNSKKLTTKQLKSILSDTDLLFNSKKFSELETFFSRKNIDTHYWLNFVAIDSDGNYFKAANLIKDVSKFHFSTLIKELANSGDLFSPWIGKKYAFNLNQMYRLVPVRKDKENVNQALILFATILEGRQIELRKLYQHFTDLILCHWYGRYRSFTNVWKSNEFDFAVKDAVFGYLAFINTLQQLNLLKNLPPMNDVLKENIGVEIESFFQAMNYQSSQQALFYLGRALNQAAYKQKERGNKKAVLEKLNYNGMDKRSIYRLSTDLFEKGKQYNFVEKIQWNLGEFNRRFDFNSWNMNPQEALFFILSGYTYGIKSNPTPDTEDKTESE